MGCLPNCVEAMPAIPVYFKEKGIVPMEMASVQPIK
jgi:hypothetical protein